MPCYSENHRFYQERAHGFSQTCDWASMTPLDKCAELQYLKATCGKCSIISMGVLTPCGLPWTCWDSTYALCLELYNTAPHLPIMWHREWGGTKLRQDLDIKTDWTQPRVAPAQDGPLGRLGSVLSPLINLVHVMPCGYPIWSISLEHENWANHLVTHLLGAVTRIPPRML